MKKLLIELSSLKLALIGLVGLFIIVLWGTFVQIDLGIFYTQKKYFQSLIIFHTFNNGIKIPIFFGGVVWGSLLTMGLMTTLITRIKWKLKNAGLILIHLGLIALLVGSFLTGKLAQESQLILREGETKNYSINRNQPELLIRLPQDNNLATEWVFPYALLKPGAHLQIPGLLDIYIKSFYLNSAIKRSIIPNTELNGFGQHFNVIPIPLNNTTEGNNTISMVIAIKSANQEFLGNWVVTQGIDADQLVTVQNQPVYIKLRDQRIYTPYSITLRDFTHDVYPGTTVPKNFSSLVTINHPETHENRDVLIYMNHPLRYAGKTYFQASFGENNQLSVLQVVENPVWLFPYFSSLIIAVGLGLQFLISFSRFKEKKS